ncbi:pentapeptide repeat-containing protein [Streptomyces virginiae]|uniref:pentapeptide repeat-containing protein n=1 Tax=Streptomyces virginiae TaxID=1961 RepID=UPI0034348B93
MTPGSDIDHRGTPFTDALLRSLLDALRDPGTGVLPGTARFGAARFDSATFHGDAWFNSAAFERDVSFDSATFTGDARFDSATFKHDATFNQVTFHGHALFPFVTFHGRANFISATFKREAGFLETAFKDAAHFGLATFQSVGWFKKATIDGNASFEGATFEQSARFGPLLCKGTVTLSEAVFNGPANLELATRHLVCERTRWLSTAELRLRYATVDFALAVFERPLTIAAAAAPFVRTSRQSPDATVRVISLRGVDAAHLVLADVDLSGCRLTGTVNLDQVRLDGACSFGKVPSGTHWPRWYPVRFTPRRTLAEEHHWRANQPKAVQGWNAAEPDAVQVGPAQLAAHYRALRKAFEDGKNEPGAADFYYGEMEMRRHDRTDTTQAERSLLHGYWLLSGYGLRASRALGWLAAAMLVTIVLLMGFGLPQASPKQQVTGIVPPGGGSVTLKIDEAAPQNPTGNRFTSERFEKALNVTLNSVVFRSSGQDLTTAGTYIERTSRLLEPVLLALVVLAIRGRIKR